jgi:hypothetical protein
MTRTYRQLRQTMRLSHRRWFWAQGLVNDGKVRDGTLQYHDPSCAPHGGCPWCEGNRTFFAERQAPLVDDFFF